MKLKPTILILLLLLAFSSFSQKVSNIHFEQVGKQIHIYYDLEGDQEYTIQVFCSTNNGQSWGEQLRYVTGAVGEKQKPGKGKMIVWNVLAEREKLSGEVRFKVEAGLGNIGTFTDARDGQIYKWVKIGKQVWMAENLNYKTANSWCYENKATNCDKYGRLYKWEAARIACPTGWHLLSDDEWKTLEMYLGMSQDEADDTGLRGTNEGKKLKSTSDWNSSGNGTDEVGFMALPGSYRRTSGDFYYMGNYGTWWSATASGSTYAWYRYLTYNYDGVYRGHDNKNSGFSVRCLRD
jgi:uncharacterized protein (TIGR02145 family)